MLHPPRRHTHPPFPFHTPDLYEDFTVVKTPLLNEEVRGSKRLEAFSEFLLKKYDPSVALPPALS